MSIRKTAKRIFAAIGALVLSLAMVTPAFAASITINGNDGETYDAYKLFDVSVSESDDGTATGYSYYTTDKELVEVLEGIGLTFTSGDDKTYYVNTKMGDNLGSGSLEVVFITKNGYLTASGLASLLSVHVDELGDPAGSVTLDLNGNSVVNTIDDLDPGYYFVTSSLGSLCMLNTTIDSVTINDKNEEPTVEKNVSSTDAQIGDTVTYTVTIDVPANTERLVLHDTLSDGLTLNGDSFTVSIDTLDPLPPVVNPTVTSNEDGSTSFVLDLTSYVSEMSADATITVTYTATINESAIHTNPATNEAYIEYDNGSSSTSTETTTYTHAIYLTKVDENGDKLDGAEFQLTDKAGNIVYVIPVCDENGSLAYYRYAFSSDKEVVDSSFYQGATSTIVVEGGSVVIEGLDSGTYYLTETKAPDGYNLLTSSVTVEIADGGVSLYGTAMATYGTVANITVTNEAGSILPGTGGTGTTTLYVVGGVLVVAAGVALVVRRRMSSQA